MISSILLINQKGEILIHRSYKGDVSRSDALVFCNRVVAAKETGETPIQQIGACHFVHTQIQGDITLVAITTGNSNVMLILKFLYKLVDVFKAYFGAREGVIDENAIRKHFVLIYELLDEIIDYGFPQILEIDILKKYITQGGTRTIDLNDAEQLKKITTSATGSTSWRAEGIKHRKNEVYIDVIENVNVLISQKGQVLRADVAGEIKVKCQLSGMPECKFGMNDKLVMTRDGNKTKSQDRGIALDDVRFHQCVRLSKFDLERTITFIPPDGVFELMSYRITENINLPFKILPVVQERGRTKIEYSVKIKANFERNIFATDVVVKIPCPRHTAKGNIVNIGAGKAKYESSQQAIMWRIKRFPGDTEYTLFAEAELAPSTQERQWSRPPIAMAFQVPMFTASGLRVRFLRIQEKSNYKPVKWIRYITKAGSYQHRI